MKQIKKKHNFSKVLEKIEEEMESLEKAEMSYKALGDYHSCIVISAQLRFLNKFHTTIDLMQFEK